MKFLVDLSAVFVLGLLCFILRYASASTANSERSEEMIAAHVLTLAVTGRKRPFTFRRDITPFSIFTVLERGGFFYRQSPYPLVSERCMKI